MDIMDGAYSLFVSALVIRLATAVAAEMCTEEKMSGFSTCRATTLFRKFNPELRLLF